VGAFLACCRLSPHLLLLEPAGVRRTARGPNVSGCWFGGVGLWCDLWLSWRRGMCCVEEERGSV
jgi:hypothetical protein